MSGSPRKIIVIGGDSQIGGCLVHWHRSHGDHVVLTTRRLSAQPGTINLDLSNFSDDQIPNGFDSAYLCGAITSVQYCESQLERSAQVNVSGTLQAMRALAERGTFSVFFSTNLVFDGSRPHMPADAPLNPKCEYGRQKAEAENAARNEGLPVAVIRLTKVLTSSSTLLGTWKQELSAGKIIKPFFDLPMAPITTDLVVSAATQVAREKHAGTFQLSAAEDISYAEAARYIASRLGVPARLVQPVSAREVLGSHAYIPRFTSLERTAKPVGTPDIATPYSSIGTFLQL